MSGPRISLRATNCITGSEIIYNLLPGSTDSPCLYFFIVKDHDHIDITTACFQNYDQCAAKLHIFKISACIEANDANLWILPTGWTPTVHNSWDRILLEKSSPQRQFLLRLRPLDTILLNNYRFCIEYSNADDGPYDFELGASGVVKLEGESQISVRGCHTEAHVGLLSEAGEGDIEEDVSSSNKENVDLNDNSTVILGDSLVRIPKPSKRAPVIENRMVSLARGGRASETRSDGRVEDQDMLLPSPPANSVLSSQAGEHHQIDESIHFNGIEIYEEEDSKGNLTRSEGQSDLAHRAVEEICLIPIADNRSQKVTPLDDRTADGDEDELSRRSAIFQDETDSHAESDILRLGQTPLDHMVDELYHNIGTPDNGPLDMDVTPQNHSRELTTVSSDAATKSNEDIPPSSLIEQALTSTRLDKDLLVASPVDGLKDTMTERILPSDVECLTDRNGIQEASEGNDGPPRAPPSSRNEANAPEDHGFVPKTVPFNGVTYSKKGNSSMPRTACGRSIANEPAADESGECSSTLSALPEKRGEKRFMLDLDDGSALGHGSDTTVVDKIASPAIKKKRKIVEQQQAASPDKKPERLKNHTASSISDVNSSTSMDGRRVRTSTSANKKRSSVRTDDRYSSHRVLLSSNSKIGNRTGLMKFLKSSGCEMVANVEDSTTFVVPDGEIKRTAKFILAIINGKNIVTEKWVTDSARQGRLLDIKDYFPKDPKSEHEWGFRIADAVQRGKDGYRHLSGYRVYFSPFLKKSTFGLDYKEIAETAGAKWCGSPAKAPADDYIVLLINGSDPYRGKIADKGFKMLSKDVLTKGVLWEKLDFDDPAFSIGVDDGNDG